MNLEGVKINIICLLLKNIVCQVNKVRHDKYIIISKGTSRGTLWRQKVRHNIKMYFIMSKMHNFRNKAIRGGLSVVPKYGPEYGPRVWALNVVPKCGPVRYDP